MYSIPPFLNDIFVLILLKIWELGSLLDIVHVDQLESRPLPDTQKCTSSLSAEAVANMRETETSFTKYLFHVDSSG